ncbi:MAG: YtfJ family protein [Bacteroidales bacterium]|nr:YtfJ family protein [Bacteroidales bacterium]
MKKTILALLILAVPMLILNGQNSKLEVGMNVPKWVLPNASKVDHSMDTWEGKVLQINYVDPDVSDLNDPFNDVIDKAADIDKRIDKDYFQGFGIVDTKSTWKPNGVIRMIAKKKEKKYGTTILFDYDASIRAAWGVPADGYTVVIVDKNRVCRALYSGEIPTSEHEKIVQLIIELTKE